MASLDFFEKFADHVTSDRMQRNMEDKYNSGKLSQESYDKYRNSVDNYENWKNTQKKNR